MKALLVAMIFVVDCELTQLAAALLRMRMNASVHECCVVKDGSIIRGFEVRCPTESESVIKSDLHMYLNREARLMTFTL